jgi:hypothetical protein
MKHETTHPIDPRGAVTWSIMCLVGSCSEVPARSHDLRRVRFGGADVVRFQSNTASGSDHNPRNTPSETEVSLNLD